MRRCFSSRSRGLVQACLDTLAAETPRHHSGLGATPARYRSLAARLTISLVWCVGVSLSDSVDVAVDFGNLNHGLRGVNPKKLFAARGSRPDARRIFLTGGPVGLLEFSDR